VSNEQIAREAADDFCLNHTNVTTRWAKGDLEQAFLAAIEKAKQPPATDATAVELTEETHTSECACEGYSEDGKPICQRH